MDPRIHDFRDVRAKRMFVDKTLLIRKVIERPESGILLVAPRRFGKSVNLSMLRRFFEQVDSETKQLNRKLFEGLLIEDFPEIFTEHFGKYPVIYLDFKSDMGICSYDEAFDLVRSAVHEAYLMHSYLKSSGKLQANEKEDVENWCDTKKFETLASTKNRIIRALKNLARYSVAHHSAKVVVLVDEYDSACSDAIVKARDTEKIKAEEVIEQTIDLCVGAISCLAKSNNNVDRVILTGISYVACLGSSK